MKIWLVPKKKNGKTIAVYAVPAGVEKFGTPAGILDECGRYASFTYCCRDCDGDYREYSQKEFEYLKKLPWIAVDVPGKKLKGVYVIEGKTKEPDPRLVKILG